MHRSQLSIFRFGMTPVILLSIFLSLFGTPSPVYAAGLDVQPLTWNIVGLDSNKPSSGPNHFPVGVRVCNTSGQAVSNVTATLSWDSVNPYISFRPGTSGTVIQFASPDSLGVGACADFYFELEVEKNSAAYDTTRRYHVDVIAVDSATGVMTYSGSTPTPRELYVEHLVSQSRNAVTDVQYGTSEASLSSVPAGGTMALMVGQTYFIKLVGFTATQGYNQLESFINFPNTIFQVLSVKSLYSAPFAGYTIDKMYSDACGWDNVISSPTYRSCIATDDKTGGNIEVTYEVKIIKVPDSSTSPVVNPEPLSTLIYDFSGSSYHYNADFGISARYAYIVDATAIDISKSFSPATISPGSTSTLTFTLKNNAPAPVAGVSFTDTLPTLISGPTTGQMVADPATYTTSGCGTSSGINFANLDTLLEFSGGAIAPNGTCTISVSVSVPGDPTSGNYHNESSTVKVGDVDSGHKAIADLSIDPAATTPGTGICGVQMAYWNMGTSAAATPPAPALGANVTLAAAQFFGAAGATSSVVTTDPSNLVGPLASSGGGSWQSNGYPKSTAPVLGTDSSLEFRVDSSKYSHVTLQFDNYGSASFVNSNYLYVWSSTDGSNWQPVSSGVDPILKTTWKRSAAFPATNTGTNAMTYFRVSAIGANNSSGTIQVDDVRITGCSNPIQPALTKTFSPNPVVVGGTSTLTFALSNGNTVNLNGAKFTDILPSGLEYDTATIPTTTCSGTPSMAFTGNSVFDFGTTTGGIIPPGGCTVTVKVKATTPGPHQNISDFIYTTEGGTNSDPSGLARASLVAVLPPTIDKNFSPSTILTGETSTLTLILTNPNPSDALTNVSFSDALPAGMTLAADANTPQCGGAVTGAAGSSTVGFSGGTVPAGGNCSVTVTVNASGLGDYVNTSDPATVTIGGLTTGTDTASATLTVKAPNPAISILKRVSTSVSGPWYPFLTVAPGTPVYYQFTVENTGDVNLDNVSVSDPTLAARGLDLTGCAWPALARYTDAVTCVTASTPAQSGSNPNTATAQGTYTSGGETKTASSSALYTGVNSGEFNLLKQISTKPTGPWSSSITAVDPGSTVYYKFTIVNATGGPLTSINVTDIDPGVNTTGCTFTDPLPDGSATTCIVSATVSKTDLTKHTNTATAHGTDGTSTVINSLSSSAEYMPKAPDLTVTKSNNTGGTATIGTAFTWTISVENIGTETATFADGQTVLSDPLPAGATFENFGDPGLPNLTCALTASPDTITCTANGSFSMAPGDQFDVTVDARPTTAGVLSSTATVDPAPPADGNINESNEGNNSYADTVTVLAAPIIAKSFLTNPIVANVTSTLRFTITNPNTTTALTGVAFTDTLPSGMTLAANVLTPQCGGTVTGVLNGNVIALSGGSVAANSSCTLDVTVKVAVGGTYNNTSGTVTSTNGGTGNTAGDTLKVFDIQPGKEIVTTSEASTGFAGTREKVAIGEMVRYRIWAQIPEGGFTNLQLTDNLPTGLQFLDDGTARFAFVSDEAGITSNTLICTNDIGTAAGKANLPSTSVDCLLTGAISDTADAGVAFGNGEDVTFSLGNITNADNDSDDNEFVVVEFNALVLNVNSSPTINQGVDNDPASAITGQTDPNWRINTARLLVNGAQVGAESSNVNVEIAEPAITVLAKSETSGGSYLPGSAIQYTFEFTNNATGEDATTAFDIRLSDSLNTDLTPGTITISSTQGTSNVDTCAGGTLFTTSSTVNLQDVTVDVSCLNPGRSVTVEINATIKTGTAGGTTISNTGSLTYTSLPGVRGNCGTAPFACTVFTTGTPGPEISERTGAGGIGSDDAILNNYATQSANVDITVKSSNLLPVAVPDTNTAVENGPDVNGNVLTNETSLGDTPTTVTAADQGGNSITIGSAFTTAAGGSLTLNADGTYSYTPPASLQEGSALAETFNYTITDTDGDASSTTLTITVDRLPQANPDINTAIEGGIAVTDNVITNDDEGNVNATVTAADQGGNAITIGNAFATTAGGSLTLNADGTYSYTPPASLPEGGALTEVFNYTITDNDGDTSASTLTITVDRLPQANPDTNAAIENGPTVSDNLISNDDEGNVNATVTAADQGGNTISIGTAFTTAAGGSLTINADGSYSYTPPAWDNVPPAGLTETFNYSIEDADGDLSSSTLTLTVSNANQPPVANDDSTSTSLNTPVTFSATGNDTDSDGTVNSATVDLDPSTAGQQTTYTIPGEGTFTVNGSGSVTFTPVTNFVGTSTIPYTVQDNDGGTSNQANLSVTVDMPNALVAQDDSTTTSLNTPATLTDITANDTAYGTGNSILTASIDLDPAIAGQQTSYTDADGNQWSVDTATGDVTFTPAMNYVGTATIPYTVEDELGQVVTANLSVTVTNLLPQANPDTNTAVENGPAVVGNVLTNEASLGDEPTTVTAAGQGGSTITIGSAFTTAAGSSLTINSNGTYSYTPPSWNNVPPAGLVETFSYTITDVNGDTSSTTLTITITDNDRLPVADPDTNTTIENGPAVIGNVLTNEISLGDEPTTVTAADQGGNTITIGTAFTTAAGGSLTLNMDGTYSYTPPAWNNVPPAGLIETFNYTITDVDGDTSSTTLTITVSNANQPPVANDDSTSTQINTPVTFGMKGNDTDSDGTVDASSVDLDPATPGQQTTYTVPGEGTFTVDNLGNVTFTPTATFTGTSTISYTVQDNDGGTSNQANLSVLVGNNPPTATDNAGSVDIANTTYSGNMITDDDGYGVDSDPDNDPLTVTQVDGETNPANNVPGVYGSLDWAADGSYTYTLNNSDPDYLLLAGGATVTETIPYTISDGYGGTAMANLVITITGADDAPVATDDSFTTPEDTPLTGDLKPDNGSGADVPSGDGGNLWSVVDTPNHGTVTINPDGTFTYTPDANYNGPDSFTYQICDVDNDCDQATVNLTVSSVEDPAIGVAKRVANITRAGSGTFNVTLEFHLQNYGDVPLGNVRVMDDLSATFPAPNIFTVQSVTVSGLMNASLTTNAGYDGSTDLDLLNDIGSSLAVNGSGTISVVVSVLPSSSGPFFNLATVEGMTPTERIVTDDSSDGIDPDNTSGCSTCVNGDGDPTNNTKQTEINFDPNIFDPPFGFKELNASGLPVLRWTMIWINNNNFPSAATVSDPIPVGSTYEATGASSGFLVPSGAPAGSTNLGVSCTTDSAAEPAPGDAESTTSLCYYEGPTAIYPRGRIVWEGVLGPDLGATDQSNANDEVYISFAVRVATGVTSVQNVASIDADLNNNTVLTDPGEQGVATAQAAWQEPVTPVDGREGKKLPATGFAPGKITALPEQKPEQTFVALNDLWLEIPSLGVETSIVGVPKNAGAWDVDWLWEQTGWLQGTAFPTWDGNSVLTAHVYLPNGKPGPFVDLGKLRYGDRVIVHAFGERYVYEIRTNHIVLPTDMSPFKHEEKAWLTLLTCKNYDESTDTYKYRVEARAVLIKVEAE